MEREYIDSPLNRMCGMAVPQLVWMDMEAKGDTESWFYLRARAIADGKPDPMPSVSELMGDSTA
ncbi:hypothetical protein SynBOUM118_00371 [Synechococcus sp. BOUM118]|nr:hypothetical protein SynBOUM118_00371 [Synechococcus sp. BOUM118]